jgi:hypothetical protein
MVFDRRVHNFPLGVEYLAVFAISDDGTSSGDASDDICNSVERTLRGR